MSYGYTNGDGLAVLDVTKPDGATEPVSNLDDAIKQVKAYLKDPTAGPKALIDALSSSLVPAGIVRMTAAGSVPSGYLACDGSAVSRTTYSALFAAIGTTFGAGDASTTFNVPDFRGRSPIGEGTGDAVDATSWARGEKYGTENHTLDISEIPAHTHSVTQYGNLAGTAGANPIWANSSSVNSGSAGGGGSHNNLHPVLGIKFIIKT